MKYPKTVGITGREFARSDGTWGGWVWDENEKRAAEVPKRDIGRSKAAMFL